MYLRLLFLLFSFSNADDKRSCNTTSCLAECPQGLEVFENRCYMWVTNETRNWAGAERFCKVGGHLASVTSKEVHEYSCIGLEKQKRKKCGLEQLMQKARVFGNGRTVAPSTSQAGLIHLMAGQKKIALSCTTPMKTPITTKGGMTSIAIQL